MSEKRRDYITWNQYFMELAIVTAKRSKDPSTQVGACIVDDNNRVLSLGYNGFPNNCDDNEFPWGKNSDDINETKYPFVVHAELNAILNNNGKSLKDATLYVTLFPCNECTKAIIQSGIKKVIYLNEPKGSKLNAYASIKMMKAANVILEKYDDNK